MTHCIVVLTLFLLLPLFCSFSSSSLFFFNDTATTEIYTLSLHDALPIWRGRPGARPVQHRPGRGLDAGEDVQDRKSTRLNSSHTVISYAVFCLKKKKKKKATTNRNARTQSKPAPAHTTQRRIAHQQTRHE